MRTRDLQVGSRVVHGKPTELADGRGGQEAYVLAVGSYTAALGTCGPSVREYRGRLDRQPRVVVALEHKRYTDDGLQLVWEPRVVTARALMDPAEYRVKADVIRKAERATAVHERRGRQAREAAASALAEALGVPTWTIQWHNRWTQGRNRHREWQPGVYVPEDRLHELLPRRAGRDQRRRQLEALLAPVRAWEAEPAPDECDL